MRTLKRVILSGIFYFPFFLLVSCTKNNTDSICDADRVFYAFLNEVPGTVVTGQYGHDGIQITYTDSVNNTVQLTGLVCSLPDSLATDGCKVIVSGDLELFSNSSDVLGESLNADPGGSSMLFFIDIANVRKQ